MNKFKFLISFSFVLFLFFFLARPSLAVVIKTAGNLELVLDNEPLFGSSVIWAPGNSHSANFIVRNKGGDSKDVQVEAFNTSQIGGLAEKMYVRLSEGVTDFYGAGDSKTMKNFWDDGEVLLSSVAGGGEKTYTMTVAMDVGTDNEYQGTTAGFDMRIGFRGEEGAVMGVSVSGGGGEAGTPPVCTDAKPGTPTGFTASVGPGVGQVSLSWMPPDQPYTYFLVAYSDNSDSPKWGNPNVGSGNSYIVSGLGGGTYWFWLRAGNGCMPGDFVGPVSPGAIGGVPGAGPVAPGFEEGVLGEKTEELVEEAPEEPGKVAGSEVKKVCPWWWILLLLQAIIQAVYYYLIPKKEIKRWWFSPLLVSIIVLFAHEKLHQGYLPSKFCPYFLLLDLLILVIFTSGYFQLSKKES